MRYISPSTSMPLSIWSTVGCQRFAKSGRPAFLLNGSMYILSPVFSGKDTSPITVISLFIFLSPLVACALVVLLAESGRHVFQYLGKRAHLRAGFIYAAKQYLFGLRLIANQDRRIIRRKAL